MGACLQKQAPHEHKVENPKASAVVPSWTSPTYEHEDETDGGKVHLYGDVLCPYTQRVRLALQHKGVPVKTILVVPDDLTSGSFATISPDGKFPVFQDGVHKLSGSTDAILEYMEKTFTDSPLVPSEMVKEADEWVAYIRDTFTPLIRQLLYDGNPLIQQDLETKLHDAFAKLDGGIGLNRSKGPFFLGSQFTLVDVYVIPFLALVDVITYFRGLEIASTYPHLVAYKAAVSTFPSYKPVQVDIDLLKKAVAESWVQKAPLPIVLMTMLQHHSILVHLEGFVRLVDRLASVKPEDIAKDSMKRTLIGTQLRGLPKQFGQLLDLMQEHAQMEERIIFPALEMADSGLSASALKDHARDLPVMNGIREDIKGIMALKQGSSDHVEALSEVVIRLHTLQENTVEHYHEEEREQLPLLEAAGFGTKKQEMLVGQYLAVMETSHGHLLPYLLQGLQPHEIQQYLGILQHLSEQNNTTPQFLLQVSQILSNADEEFAGVWKVAQERVPALATRQANAAGA